MYLIGVAIFVFGMLSVMFFKGVSLLVLVNPAIILMLITSILAVLTASQGYKTFWRGLQAAISPTNTLSDDDRGRAASLARLLSKTSALATTVVFICGIISALRYIDDLLMCLDALTATLASIIWGVFFIIVFEFMVLILKKRQNNERQTKTRF